MKKLQGLMRVHTPSILVYWKLFLSWLSKNKLTSKDCIWCYKSIPPVDINKLNSIFLDLDSKDTVKFLQIGANDGKTNCDPIYEYVIKSNKWRGVLVEPLDFVFSRLKLNYSSRSDLIFENAAISDDQSEKIFYYVSSDIKRHMPKIKNATGLNGFNKDNIVRYHGKEIEPHIKSQVFKTITIKELISKHKINQLDILLIDVEGHEWEVIKSLSLKELTPEIIFIEHQCLTFINTYKVINKLIPYYNILMSGGDLIGILKQQRIANYSS